MPLLENERLDEEIPITFILFLEKTVGIDPASFPGVCMEKKATVEDIVPADSFFCDIDIVDGSIFGEIATRSLEK